MKWSHFGKCLISCVWSMTRTRHTQKIRIYLSLDFDQAMIVAMEEATVCVTGYTRGMLESKVSEAHQQCSKIGNITL